MQHLAWTGTTLKDANKDTSASRGVPPLLAVATRCRRNVVVGHVPYPVVGRLVDEESIDSRRIGTRR